VLAATAELILRLDLSGSVSSGRWVSLALSADRRAAMKLRRVGSERSAQILSLAVNATPGRSSDRRSAVLAANALSWQAREAAGRWRTLAIAVAVDRFAPR
jgi:hypothetical protein